MIGTTYAAKDQVVQTLMTLIDHAVLTNLVTTNFNSTTTPTLITEFNTTPLINSNPSLFTVSGSGVTVQEDGDYLVSINFALTGTSARTNVAFRFVVGGVPDPCSSAGDYIRAAGGHNEASTSLTTIISATSGQLVGVQRFQVAAAGTVTCPAGFSCFSIVRLS